MARPFPAIVSKQNFFEESCQKIINSQLHCYLEKANQKSLNSGIKRFLFKEKAERLRFLPPIEKSELPEKTATKRYNKIIKSFDETILKDIDLTLQRNAISDPHCNAFMFSPSKQTKSLLYDGLTSQNKGRYAYLKQRSELPPESRFRFPVVNSMEYGWGLPKIDTVNQPSGKSIPKRTCLINHTFYTRTGVPGMSEEHPLLKIVHF